MQHDPTPDQWRESGTYILFNGQQIFTRVEGTGEPILLLHGFPTSSYDYARLIPLLTDRFRVVAFDFLGFGFSDKPRPHPYSLFEQADVAQAVAARYGISHTHLIAHDMGSSVALELLRRPQPVVDKLVLLNGSVLLEHYRPLLLQRLLLHPLMGALIAESGLVRRPAFGRQFGSVFAERPSADEIAAFWSLIAYNDGARIYNRLIQYLNERKVYEHDWLDALKAHPAPLTIIWGQRDPVSVPQIAQAVIERRPDARYLPLDDIGHFPQWEAAERVAAAVQAVFGTTT